MNLLDIPHSLLKTQKRRPPKLGVLTFAAALKVGHLFLL